MADRFPLPAEGPGLLKELEAACLRNDVQAALAVRARIDDLRSINLGMAAIATATVVALGVDQASGSRRFTLPAWRALWISIRTEMLDNLQFEERTPDPRKQVRRPRTRDPLVEVERRMRDILRRVVHLKSLPQRGAAARREKEGANHRKLQRLRAKRPLTKEHKAIKKLLRAYPRIGAKALYRQLKAAGVAVRDRGFADRVARLRPKARSRRP